MTFGLQEIFDQAKLYNATPEKIAPQDLVGKIPKATLENIQQLMETKHAFDWEEFNLFGTGEDQQGNKDLQLGRQDMLNLATAIRNIPLREFMAKSGAITAAGLQGSNFVIPVKVYDVLLTSSIETDIVPEISRAVLGPSELPGTTCPVDIVVDNTFNPKMYSSGGKIPESNLNIIQATLDFSQSFGLHIPITNDLIEDSKFGLIEVSLQEAGKEMGEKASDLAFTIAYTGTDGDGSVNGPTTSTTQYKTKWVDTGTTGLRDAYALVFGDGFTPDLLVMSRAAMIDDVVGSLGVAYNDVDVNNDFIRSGLPTKIATMNVVYTECNYATVDKAYTTCRSIIMTKAYSLLSGRKRWLRIEHYSDPIQDLVGATISSRQDSVTMYDDSISEFIEHT